MGQGLQLFLLSFNAQHTFTAIPFQITYQFAATINKSSVYSLSITNQVLRSLNALKILNGFYSHWAIPLHPG